MLDKAHQPSASSRRAARRGIGRVWRLRGTLALVAAVTASAGTLGLAADAGAAGPVERVLGVVTRGAEAPSSAVAQALPAAAAVTPSPAQAGDAAPAPSPVAQTIERTTSAVSPAASDGVEPGGAHSTSADSQPAGEPESAGRSDQSVHRSTPTASGDASNGNAAGADTALAPERRTGPLEHLTHGVVRRNKRATAHAPRVTPGLPGQGPSAQLPSALGAATLAHVVQRLTPSPVLLDEASRRIGGLDETVTQLLGATPQALVTLLVPVVSVPFPFPSLPRPPLPLLPSLPSPASLPFLTLGSPAPPQLPTLIRPQALWPAITPVQVGDGTSPTVRQQLASPTTRAGRAIAKAASAATDVAIDASSRPGPTHANPPQEGAAAMAADAAAANRYAPATELPAPGTTAPLGARPQPAPSPSPGGVSAVPGAGAGQSIPTLLMLAGLLLLAAPRTRRVLRLLGESWRLSPLVLIPERPG